MYTKKIKENIDFITKILAIYVGLSYTFGFLIWSIYLHFLGFFPNLLQGRYILTGTVFFSITLLLVLIILIFKDVTTQKIIHPNKSDLTDFYFYTIFFVFYLFLFSLFIFPLLPGFLGGGKPRMIGIMSDSQEISYLENFNLGKASEFQTGIICSAYEDNEYIVLVLTDRILSLKKDSYKGFVSLPNKDENDYIDSCNDVIRSNITKSRILNKINP